MRNKWITMIVFLFGLYAVWTVWPDEKVRVVFCDVGQGDGAMIVWKNFQALVDVGLDNQKMERCVSEYMPLWDRNIEIVFISHYDKDHAGALEKIKNSYQVKHIFENPMQNDMYKYGDLYFEIVKGKTKNDVDSNSSSVVMRFSYHKLSVLFTGDVDTKVESELLRMGRLGKSTVLKVSHHGSKYATGEEFLSKVSPELAVVSVGKNSYGHPTEEVLERLSRVGSKVLRTDREGTIKIESDGDSVMVFAKASRGKIR